MSSYTTIWNPGSKQDLLIFGISAGAHLDLSIWPDGSGKPGDPTKTSNLAKGIMTVPSNLASMNLKNLLRVYGFVNVKNDKQEEESCLYMISPVYEVFFDIKVKSGSLAGVSDGKDVGYLYYMNASSDIVEHNVSGGKPTILTGTVKLKAGTSIGACWGVNGRRYVAYQLGDGKIQVYDVSQLSALPTIDDTVNAKERTPLTVIQYKKDGADWINVYYIRKDDERIVRASTALSSVSWMSKSLPDFGNPTQSTSLSSSWSESASKVVVTYQKGETERATCRIDNI